MSRDAHAVSFADMRCVASLSEGFQRYYLLANGGKVVQSRIKSGTQTHPVWSTLKHASGIYELREHPRSGAKDVADKITSPLILYPAISLRTGSVNPPMYVNECSLYLIKAVFLFLVVSDVMAFCRTACCKTSDQDCRAEEYVRGRCRF